MVAAFSLLLSALAIASASPLEVRTVAALDQAAFQEAQQRDDTATRAFSSTEIKNSNGQCLFIDELSGDFRANLTPVQAAACDGSAGQQWDIITSGKHDNQAGTMLVVSTLTQACLNFDPRRAAGNTVILFSCGGRADGGGDVTNSQLFTFSGGAGPLAFEPENAVGTCLALTSSNVLDQAPCNAGDVTQSFTFGGAQAAPAPAASSSGAAAPLVVPGPTAAPVLSASLTTLQTITTAPVAVVSSPAVPSSPAAASAVASAAQQSSGNPTSAVPVSRAGGTLDPSSAAEANPRDSTATRAFSSASIKSSDGKCLVIDPAAGDFRQNLIPIQVQECTGGAGEKFDIITQGVHNNEANSTLVVSSETQGCLNFDPRRATGDTIILFSCGGRADGGGQVTNSQLFQFGGGNSIVLSPENSNGQTCLFDNAGKLDSTACTGDAGQVFTIQP